MKRLLKFLLPLLVLAGGLLGARALIQARKPAESQALPREVPVVEVVRVRSAPHRLEVETQGEVEARSEIDLVAEVAGQVIEVAPQLESGNRFAAGDVLLRIDPTDYELALTRADAEVASTQAALEVEEAEAELAKREWQRLGKGEPTALVMREPQLAQARARVAAAEAAQQQAGRDLERCTIRAPFDGVVRHRHADLGAYLVPTAPIARIFAVDYAEVRLPLTAEDLAALELPADGQPPDAGYPTVRFRGVARGVEHRWTGRLVRVDAALDPATRMLFGVARIAAPFAADPASGRPPLAVGTFLHATVEGRRIPEAWVVPRAALLPGDEVLVVDQDQRLHPRRVTVVQARRGDAVIGDGLHDGDRLCITPLDAVVEGMQVEVLSSTDVGGETGR